MRTIIVCFLCGALMLLAGCFGCHAAEKPLSPPLLSPPLIIGVLPAADTLALHVSAEEGVFRAHGLEVRLVPFQSAFELAAAVRAKAVNGFFGDLINVLLLHAGGLPQQVVAVTSHAAQVPDPDSPRHFGVVVPAPSPVRTLHDLAGKDVAIGRATIVDFLLDRMLEREGLPSKHVRHLDIRQIPIRLQMLGAGQVAAAVLPEPLLSLVEAQGAHVIADDRGLNLPLAVVAWDAPLATPERVRAFQAALAEAMRRITAAPADWQPLMLGKGLLPRGAAASYRMVSFDPALLPVPLPSVAAVDRYATWMRERGVLRQAADSAGIVPASSSGIAAPLPAQ